MKNILLVILFCIFLSSCTRYQSQDGLQTPTLTVRHTTQPTITANYFGKLTSPEDIPLECYFINVMGKQIGDWDANASVVQTSPFGYYGKYTTKLMPLNPTGSLSLKIEAGDSRIVQVIGLKSNIGCPDLTNIPQKDAEKMLDSLSNFPGMYELARVTTDIITDTTVDVVLSYNPDTADDVRRNHNNFLSKFSISSATPGDQQVTLDWSSAGNFVSSYTIKRGTSSGSYPTTVSTSAIPPFVDTGLTNGTTYYYMVIANNSDGVTRDAVSEASANPYGVPILAYSSSATTGIYGTALSISPTILNSNGRDITGCDIKSNTTALPIGLTVDPTTCVISGTPAELASLTNFTVVATNLAGISADATFPLLVNPGIPTIKYPANAITVSVNSPLLVIPTISPSNGATITSCSVSGLPIGLTISSSNCSISGIPTVVSASQSYTATINTTGGSTTATFTLEVKASKPTVSYSTKTVQLLINSPVAITPTALNSNGSPITNCQIIGGIPIGLSINSTTCVISGIPSSKSDISTSVTVTNALGSTSTAIRIIVVPGALTFSYNDITATIGSTFTTVGPKSMTTNGATIINCTTFPALPTGFSIAPSTCKISLTGVVSNTIPIGTTIYTVTAVHDGTNNPSSASFKLTITSGGRPTVTYPETTITLGDSLTASNPTLNSSKGTTSALGNSLTALTPTLSPSNGATITGGCSSSPTLPTGLSIDTNTCVISGTPVEAQDQTTYIISMNTTGGSTTANLSLGVSCNPNLFAGGTGTAQNPYLITTQTHLANVGKCTLSTANFKQTGNITLSGSWSPITLRGTYDGQNYFISRLVISDSNAANNVGLFKSIASTGTVKNLVLSNVDVTGAGMTGALAGVSSGAISNCSSSGTVKLAGASSVYAGGLVGQLSGASAMMTNSSSSANVVIFGTNGTALGIGGLVGIAQSGSSITGSYSTGNVTNDTSYNTGTPTLGGLVGYLSGSSISNSYANGNSVTMNNVNGTTYMGFVGYSDSSSTISGCFSKSTYTVTGFIRYAYVGGMGGYITGTTISDSYSMSSITLGSGLPVNGGAFGGFVGSGINTTLSRNYLVLPASPTTVGAGSIGAFLGAASGVSVSGNYYYTGLSLSEGLSAATSMALANTALQSTHSGFDFSTNGPWTMPTANPLKITETGLSPVLKWQCGGNGITCGAPTVQ